MKTIKQLEQEISYREEGCGKPFKMVNDYSPVDCGEDGELCPKCKPQEEDICYKKDCNVKFCLMHTQPQNHSPVSDSKDTPEDELGIALVSKSKDSSGTHSQQGAAKASAKTKGCIRSPLPAGTFILSEKIELGWRANDVGQTEMFLKRDVKEFIKRLKKDLKCDCGNAYRCPNCQIILKIDNLAGENLVK